MAIKFNPLTGNFDFTGSGGGGDSYIDGEVATYADLPLDGTAAINSAWLVRTASGVWPVTRKQAGIYIRTATGGSNRDSDYTYAGTLPDVFSDSQFLLYDNSDSTRNLAFDLGSISTGTTRTLTVPNASGRIQVEGQPIGNVTAAAGSFTTVGATDIITAANATSAPPTTTSAARGVLFPSLGGANNQGAVYGGYPGTPTIGIGLGTSAGALTQVAAFTSTGLAVTGGLAATTSLTLGTSGILTGGTNLIEQVNSTNAQTFRVYNTFTATDNFERGFFKWSSNVLQIGTEKGSAGGTARALELQTDGVTRMTLGTDGHTRTSGQLFVGGSSVGFYYPGGAWAGVNGALAVVGTLSLNNSLNAIITADAADIIAIKRGAVGQTFRVYNVDGTNFERANFRWASNEFVLDAEKGGTGTLRGIKLGGATSSLLGFFGATPVVQQAAVADATDAASTQARLNDLLARLRTLGLIAT